jgi:hypothetical protein
MDFSKEAIDAANTIKSFLESGETIFGMSKITGAAIPEKLAQCVKFYSIRKNLDHDEYIKHLKKLIPNYSEETYEASYYYDVVMFNRKKFENLHQNSLETMMNDWFNGHIMEAKASLPEEKYTEYFNEYYAPEYGIGPIPPKEES